ncbi:BTB/POZ domain-containing protein At5g48130-like [Durio zibethinus]|uniref:BTB/POZ domain-containing protein At5g48130-like n=1 Tax=Durio zibethinus TaxID=66656 RepID=A0A6P6A2H9_DURZI|nr:BTB/POZ domain-containing protein At5g48130-like [Durio zibethinus]
MTMEVSSSKDSSVASSPFSSPNVSCLLKIRIISWSQETGLPVSMRVRVGQRTFCLHKDPLFSKSGYFHKRLTESNELDLPQDFPGGPETFEMIALFIYGSTTLVDPCNVAALRCAAEFLEMTEEYCIGNLCERFDLYLNQVVLQSWDDTLIVLQKCQMLLPWSEELLIVSRCIESLAFMACMEILDPERRRDEPVVTIEALAGEAWSCETVKAIASKDLWIKDLIALPFGFFKRIIGSLRRQGMKEKYVTPIIVFYANKWVLSKKTRQFWENPGEKIGDSDTNNKVSVILQGILDLLPIGEKASRAIPVGFYFALLSRSLEFGLRSDSKVKLQDQIASMLHFAQVEDFLLPQIGTESFSSSKELATMKSIFSTFASFNMDTNPTPSASNSIVAELWDTFLVQIASDPEMEPKKFMELVELLPISCRQSHDQLYRAMNSFLLAHRDITQDEKGSVCKYLNCQKLSQEACIEAVQNELMPLRLIVQALFVQQLNTHQAFKECSDSFRFTGQFSGSLSSSRCPNSNSLNLGESPYKDGAGTDSKPLSLFLRNDLAMERSYESTSFRIQNLEQELMSLKKSLQWHNMSKKTDSTPNKSQSMKPYGIESRLVSRRRNPLGQVTGCMGSLNFASQRKYASRLIKIFRRFSLFGIKKLKREPGASGIVAKSI